MLKKNTINRKVLVYYLRLILKALFEFIPLLLFFISFEIRENFFVATFVLIFSTILFTFYLFHKEKRLPYIALFISLETTFFGGLTLFFRNPAFVQMRDTFYDLLLGTMIIVTGIYGHPIIKKFFGHIFELENSLWIKLSYMWGPLLITFAVFNEHFRRNFPPHIWINYKMFVMMITTLFGLYCVWIYRKQVKNIDLI